MRKKRFLILILPVILIVALLFYPWIHTVGWIGGTESEWVEIDGVRYVQTECELNGGDRRRIIGRLTGNYSAHAFRVKGSENGEFIYVAAAGRGEFYKIDP